MTSILFHSKTVKHSPPHATQRLSEPRNLCKSHRGQNQHPSRSLRVDQGIWSEAARLQLKGDEHLLPPNKATSEGLRVFAVSDIHTDYQDNYEWALSLSKRNYRSGLRACHAMLVLTKLVLNDTRVDVCRPVHLLFNSAVQANLYHMLASIGEQRSGCAAPCWRRFRRSECAR